MNKSRRIGAVVAVVCTAVGVASLVAIGPASAVAAHGPRPVSGWLQPVRAHSMSLVDIYWRTDRTVCDIKVWVVGSSVDVTYPGHRRYASFSRGTMLRAGRTNYTTVQISPDSDRSGTAGLRAIVSYDSCGFHARTQTSSYPLTLPVLRNDTWPGHGFPGANGQGSGGNGQGSGQGHGAGGQGDGSQGNGDQHHGQPASNPTPTTTSSPAPAASPTTTPTAPSDGNGHSHGPGSGGGNGGHDHGGQGQPTS